MLCVYLVKPREAVAQGGPFMVKGSRFLPSSTTRRLPPPPSPYSEIGVRRCRYGGSDGYRYLHFATSGPLTSWPARSHTALVGSRNPPALLRSGVFREHCPRGEGRPLSLPVLTMKDIPPTFFGAMSETRRRCV